jgi:hypothetical protein
MRHRIYIPLADQPGSLRPSDARAVGNGQFSVVGRARRTVFGWCGAFVGAILGLLGAIFLGFEGISLLAVAAGCSMAFAWSSMRWGDDAWEVLSRLLR